MKMESACGTTSSGMSVGCIPPMITGTPRARYSALISYARRAV
jgi:hypothetical protein